MARAGISSFTALLYRFCIEAAPSKREYWVCTCRWEKTDISRLLDLQLTKKKNDLLLWCPISVHNEHTYRKVLILNPQIGTPGNMIFFGKYLSLPAPVSTMK